MKKFMEWIKASKRNTLISMSVVLAMLVITVVVVMQLQKDSNDTEKVTDTNSNLDVSDIKTETYDQIVITAEKNTEYGVPVDSAFVLNCPKDITLTKEQIVQQLTIDPEMPFQVEQVDPSTYSIKFSSRLPVNTIVKMKYAHESEQVGYAFQTIEPFWIRSIYPAPNSMDVPVNAGIELSFSRPVTSEIESYISIEPEIDAKFTVKDNKLIIVPKEDMIEMTDYTVTISDDYQVEGETLEGKSFSFKTTKNWDVAYWVIGPKVKRLDDKGLQALFYHGKIQSDTGKATVYRISKNQEAILLKTSEKEIINAIIDTQEGDYSWESELKVDQTTDYNGQLVLSENLPKGLYYLVPDFGESNSGIFVQVTSYYSYITSDPNHLLVWLQGDLSVDGNVSVNGTALGSLGSDGCELFDIALQQDKETIIRVDLSNEALFFPVMQNLDYVDPWEKYFSFLTTDRQIYLPTDTIHINGYVQNRIGKRDYNEVTVNLTYDDKIIASQIAKVSEIGTYVAELDIQEFRNDWLTVEVVVNEEVIQRNSVNVFEFEKPKYVLTSSFNRAWIKQGESIEWNGNLSYYSGAPVVDASVQIESYGWSNVLVSRYKGKSDSTSIQLNSEDGNFLQTFYVSSTEPVWRPQWVNLNSRSDESDNYYLYANSSTYLFPSDRMIEASFRSTGRDSGILSADCHVIDPYLIKQDITDPNEFRSVAVEGMPLQITITEEYFEPVLVRQEYNEIYKETYDIYKYVRHVDTILSVDEQTDSEGHFDLAIGNIVEGHYYRVNISGEDSQGYKISEEIAYGSNLYYDESQTEPVYRLNNLIDSDQQVDYGQELTLTLTKDGQSIGETDKDKMLIIEKHDGIKGYKILDATEYTLTFDDSYLPNASVKAVYYTGKYLKTTWEMEYQMYLDRTSRELNLDVSYDKETYRPGETVHYSVQVTDKEGNKKQADVNLSVVDESIFALWEGYKNPIEEMYHYNYSNHILTEYVFANNNENFWGGAESGGEGGTDGLRSEFKNTAYFETSTTDASGYLTGSFVLPDNMTKWRTTVTAFSKDVQGTGKKTWIQSNLPLFADVTMEEHFLVNDEIQILGKAAGDYTYRDEMIQLDMILMDQDNKELLRTTQEVVFGQETPFVIGKLKAGTYQVEISVQKGDVSDRMLRTFQVVESKANYELHVTQSLTEDMKLFANGHYMTVEILNQDARKVLESFEKLLYTDTRRTENKISALFTKYYLDKTFYESDTNVTDFSQWMETKGITGDWILGENSFVKPLENSEGSPFLTAVLLNIGLEDYIGDYAYGQSDLIKTAFYETLDQNYVRTTDYAASIWGLSKMGIPMLLTVNKALENFDDMESFEGRLCLIQSMIELGDTTRAKKLLERFYTYENINYDQVLKTGSFDPSQEKDENLKASMLSIATKLGQWELADAIYRNILETRSSMGKEKYRTVEPELYYYLTSKPLPVIESDLSYSLNKEQHQIRLDFKNVLKLVLSPEEAETFMVNDFDGALSIRNSYIGNADLAVRGTKVTITREYTNKTSPEKPIKVGDEVYVNIRIDSDEMINGFTVQDSLPSGLTYTECLGSNNLYINAESKGNTVNLSCVVRRELNETSTHRKFNYITVATLPGEYEAEAMVVYIPELQENGIGERSWVSIR